MKDPAPLAQAPLAIVLPVVHPHSSSLLVNVSLVALLELSHPPVLVFRVIPIVPPAPALLSTNVRRVPSSVLFFNLDVAY